MQANYVREDQSTIIQVAKLYQPYIGKVQY